MKEIYIQENKAQDINPHAARIRILPDLDEWFWQILDEKLDRSLQKSLQDYFQETDGIQEDDEYISDFKKGFRKSFTEGYIESFLQSYEESALKTIEKFQKNKLYMIAAQMLNHSIDIEFISKVLELSLDEVLRIESVMKISRISETAGQNAD